MKKNDIGVIGLAVMGSNLALNMADHGYEVALYNRTYAVGEKVLRENKDNTHIHLYKTIEEFVSSLEKPRKIILMVKAGQAVDKVLETLVPLLEPNDIVMDGGNSYFEDTIKRNNSLKDTGIHYMGVGISGGEEGARFGPAIMPGGSKEAYSYVGPILEDIAAKKNNEPCCTYIGDNGAGHYVKMVHNGIEYADMQLIAESYSILKEVGKFSNQEIADIFALWNQGELESFLIDITKDIFKTKDDLTDNDIIDVILDVAKQKGTGKWTAMQALETNTDASLLASAVFSRFISDYKPIREQASKLFDYQPVKTELDKDVFIETVRKALYASKIIAYAQGFDLMKQAGQTYGWDLNFGEIAKIFREGCIIRAQFLDRITESYERNPQLENLMFDDFFKDTLIKYQYALREIACLSISQGISIPSFSSAISYFDGMRTENGNANLIQAQRDYFGAHTYERKDRDGSFHFDWIKLYGKK